MGPNLKNSDAGSAFKPARSRDVVSFSEEVKILDMIEIEKKYFVIARLYGKAEFSDCDLIKNYEINTCYSFCCTANGEIYCFSA